MIHHAGRNGAPWHAVEGRGLWRLGKHHAARALDGTHAKRAVAACAGEHDTDGKAALVVREGAEEEIDWQPLVARFDGVEQLEASVEERHVASGRNDVRAVGAHRHAVLDFKHLHPGVAPNDFREHTLVIGREMLHEHERHAGVYVGRHAGKECLKRGESTGRRADAHHGKARGRRRECGAHGGGAGRELRQ